MHSISLTTTECKKEICVNGHFPELPLRVAEAKDRSENGSQKCSSEERSLTGAGFRHLFFMRQTHCSSKRGEP